MGLFNSVMTGLGFKEQRTFGGIDVPTIEDIPAVVNEIFGITTETEEFTRPDGTKGTRVVTRGATPEQQEFIASLQDQLISTVGDIQNLSQIGAAIENEAFDPVVQAVRENQQESREDAFRQRSRVEEEVLAKRGIEDSTAAIEARQQRGSDLSKQATADERDLVLLAEELRAQQLQRSGVGLGATQGTQQQLAAAGQGTAGQFQNLGALQLSQAGLGLQSELATFESRLAAQQQQSANFGQTLGAIGTMTGLGGRSGGAGFSGVGPQGPLPLPSGGAGGSTGLLSFLTTAGKALSDERLKENIEFMDNVDGINWYSYTYTHDLEHTPHVGVMAQEVMFSHPEAVSLYEDTGYLQVDYSKLN